MSNETPSSRAYYPMAVALIFAVPALGSFLFGYDIGATSFFIVQLQSPDYSGVNWYDEVANSPATKGLIVSATAAGALIGSTLAFRFADEIGRRMELRYGSILYMIGALMECCVGLFLDAPASTGPVFAIAFLILGRLVYGTGVGFAMHGAPTYLGEMIPSQIRGPLVSMNEVSIVLGILMGYLFGFLFSEMVGGWVYTFALTIFVGMAVLILSFRIPYSARWLMLRERPVEARASLEFVFPPEAAAAEFAAMESYQRESNVTLDLERQPSLFDPIYRPALRAGVGLIVLQQITGQPSVLSYATPIFVQAGLASSSSVLVAAFKLVATLSAVLTVEDQGRTKLLYIGCSIMLVALLVLSISFKGEEDRDNETDEAATGLDLRTSSILAAMFLYIGGYQAGFGPITWLIISEVFPLNVRGQAVAVAVQTNFLLNAVVQFGVPVLQSLVGLSATFFVFALLTAYSLYFIYAYVPETKGLSLEQIEGEFQRRFPVAKNEGNEAMGEKQPLV